MPLVVTGSAVSSLPRYRQYPLIPDSASVPASQVNDGFAPLVQSLEGKASPLIDFLATILSAFVAGGIASEVGCVYGIQGYLLCSVTR